MKIKDLKLGDFVILRCEGDGDYIRDAAEKIYKNDYFYKKEKLNNWKYIFQEIFIKEGGDNLVSMLIRNGATDKASKVGNIRNWASLETIQCKDIQDFRAIMKIINQEDQSNELFQVGKDIQKYHNIAGRKVFADLKKEFTKLDKNQKESLYERGHLKISTEIGASLDVFQIINFSDNIFKRPKSQINRPFKLEI